MTTISNSDLKTYLGIVTATINSNFKKAKENMPAQIATSVTSSSTNAETVGAKLFYDTCGDIETLINAL